jgi:hypothetical protein
MNDTLANLSQHPPARGSRRERENIPPNMLPRFLASEARAWAHSTLAGALWESGVRASRAIRMAENYFPASHNNSCQPSKTLADSPRRHDGGTAPAEPGKPLEIENMKTIVIPQKQSNTGSIHDISSAMMAREIKIPAGTSHIIVLSSYYGGRGYSTHQSAASAAAKIRSLKKDNYSFRVFSDTGENLEWDGWDFRRGEPMLDLA